jgi:hypothetical protein
MAKDILTLYSVTFTESAREQGAEENIWKSDGENYIMRRFTIIFFKRHLQSFADLWPTLMGFSIYI